MDEQEVKQKLLERADKMESTLTEMLEHFKKVIYNGPVKQQLEKALENYLKVQENGCSKFKQDIFDDFNMCIKFLAKSKELLPENELLP